MVTVAEYRGGSAVAVGSRNALFDSGYIFCVSTRATFGRISGFLVVRSIRLLRSILVLLFSMSDVAALVVDHSSGLFSTGLAGDDAPRAVFPTFGLSQNGEVCTVDASAAEQFFLENLDIFLRAPCIFAVFFAVGALRQLIFWEPSTTKSSSLSRALGGGGVAGSQTPR